MSEKNLHIFFSNQGDVARQMIKYATKSQTIEEIEDFKRIIKILSFPTYIFRNSFSTYGKGYQVNMILIKILSLPNSYNKLKFFLLLSP